MSTPRPLALPVHLVEDDPVLRAAFRLLLEDAHLSVIDHADAESLLDSLSDGEPAGCVLLDLRLPGMDGQEALISLRQRRSDVPVIMLTGSGDVAAAVAAIKAGATDFLVKPVMPDKLLATVAEVLHGSLANQLDRAQEEQQRQRLASLTPREREVADLVVAGYTSKEIGRILQISPRTVEVHRSHVMNKLEADTLPDLVRMLAQFG